MKAHLTLLWFPELGPHQQIQFSEMAKSAIFGEQGIQWTYSKNNWQSGSLSDYVWLTAWSTSWLEGGSRVFW